MIISFSGDEGSGKSTIAKRVSEELGYSHYYMGQIFRDMAKKKGLTLIEYIKLGEADPSIDKKVDNYLLKLAKKQESFVIESRTAWYLIPNSLKVYLKVDEREGAKRIFKQLREEAENSRNELRKADLLENVLDNIRRRREMDDLRYQKYYGINIREPKNYNLFLDTTKLTRDEVFDHVINFIKHNQS